MKRALVSFLLAFPLFSFSQEKIDWMTWEKAAASNKQQPKKYFVDVYTNWCGWCKKMDASTFTHPRIIELMNKYFYAVKFNAEGNDTIIHQNKTYTNPSPDGRRSVHDFAPFILNGRLSYPTIVMFSKDQNSFGPIPGYQTAKALEPMLIFIGEELYLTQKWEDYIKTFNGEIE